MTKPVALEPAALRAAMAAAGEDARPLPDCPPPDSLWRAVGGELGPEAAREIVDHVSVCPVCAEAWDLAVDLGRDLGDEAREPEVTERRIGAPLRRAGAWWIAALLALALAGPFLLRSGEDTLRGEAGSLRSRLAADEVLPRDHCLLRWAGPEAAVRYELELSWATSESFGTLPGAREIVAGETGGEYLVPASDLREVPPGARLLWRIRALGDDGPLAEKTFTATLE